MKKKLLFFIFGIAAINVVHSQNDCNTPTPTTTGIYVVSSIDGAPSLPCYPNEGSATAAEWFSYTPASNYNVTITTDLVVNVPGDTRFQIYSGSCDNLQCVAGDDDSGVLGDPSYLSVITFPALAGTTYTIAFDNNWNSNGFTFEVTEGPYVPPVPTLISFSPQTFPMTAFYRSCVVDMNGDYLDDIVGVQPDEIQILQQNSTGGGFTNINVPTPYTNNLPVWSIAAGDINNDGRNDLLYGAAAGVSFMIQNALGNAFTEESGSEDVFCQRSNFVDINNDGNLDAFVCHDIAPNVHYINDGNGNFSFIQGGMGDFPQGGNYGSIWVDYDNDGDPDLFIAKCRGDNSGANIDELHRNNGDGTFTDVSVEANMNEASQSWSSAWADYDNDGDMDAMIGVSSFSTGGHKLRRNNGNGTFSDETLGSGFDTFTGQDIENVAHDFDNDGFVDILTANHTIMHNNGDFTFSPIAIMPANGPIGDLNNDGFLDIQNGNNIFYNNGNNNNWITVNLQGIESNRNGIGARVEIYGSWGKQIRDVRSGDGFRNMSSLNVYFGIGTAETIDKLVVKWPSGIIDEVLNLTKNQRLLVVEGATLSIGNIQNLAFTIYPNPANDIINFNLKSEENVITRAIIFDTLGRKVLQVAVTDQSVNIHSLTTGTYIIILKNREGKSFSSKFIKK